MRAARSRTARPAVADPPFGSDARRSFFRLFRTAPPGRAVPYRRQLFARRRWYAVFRRPQEEHHSPVWREHRCRRGGGHCWTRIPTCKVAVMAVQDRSRGRCRAWHRPEAAHGPAQGRVQNLPESMSAYYKAPGWIHFRARIPPTGAEDPEAHHLSERHRSALARTHFSTCGPLKRRQA